MEQISCAINMSKAAQVPMYSLLQRLLQSTICRARGMRITDGLKMGCGLWHKCFFHSRMKLHLYKEGRGGDFPCSLLSPFPKKSVLRVYQHSSIHPTFIQIFCRGKEDHQKSALLLCANGTFLKIGRRISEKILPCVQLKVGVV